MKLIPLSQGKHAIVDDDDFEWLSQWRWCVCQRYAVRNLPRRKMKREQVIMHRAILERHGLAIPNQVDHINGNRLDSRKVNLRLADFHQNGCNRTAPKHNTSGFKGVTKTKNGKWEARIKVRGVRTRLGIFNNPLDAARAYDEASSVMHGAFARPSIRSTKADHG